MYKLLLLFTVALMLAGGAYRTALGQSESSAIEQIQNENNLPISEPMIAVNPANANNFITSYSNWVNNGPTRLPGVSYTTDGGASWSITDSVIITPSYVSPVSFGEKLFAVGGHLYSSFSIGGVDELEDGKWVNVFQNANGLWLAGDSPDNIFGLGSFGYLYWYNGASWTSLNVGANSSIAFFDVWSNGSQTFITGDDDRRTYIFHGN